MTARKNLFGCKHFTLILAAGLVCLCLCCSSCAHALKADNDTTALYLVAQIGVAVQHNNLPEVKKLFAEGVNPALPISRQYITGYPQSGFTTPLLLSACQFSEAPINGRRKGDTRILEFFLDQGIRPNYSHRGGFPNNVPPPAQTLLHAAAKCGNYEAVALLLKRGARVNGPPDKFYIATPYLEAARKGHIDVCRLLAEHGANGSVQDAYGNNALHLAMGARGHETGVTAPAYTLEDVRFFIQNGADPNALNAHFQNALTLAASFNRTDVYSYLRSLGVDENQRDSLSYSPKDYMTKKSAMRIRLAAPSPRSSAGQTTSAKAADPFPPSVQALLYIPTGDPREFTFERAAYYDIIANAPTPFPPFEEMIAAVALGDMKRVQRLFKQGLDAREEKDDAHHVHLYGVSSPTSPLKLAARQLIFNPDEGKWLADTRALEFFLEQYLAPGTGKGEAEEFFLRHDLLNEAVKSRNEGAAKLLLERGANPNRMKVDYDTPTYITAARNGDLALCKVLVAHGANGAVSHSYGQNALMKYLYGLPVEREKEFFNQELMRFLIQNGCDINARDASGNTALIIAARGKLRTAYKALLALGADPSIKGEGGKTAKMLLAR